MRSTAMKLLSTINAILSVIAFVGLGSTTVMAERNPDISPAGSQAVMDSKAKVHFHQSCMNCLKR